AFVSNRENHSFIGVYDMTTHTVSYLSPSVDFDTAPVWSPDSRQIAFVRRPGLPFGRQGQAGTGSIGNPAGPAGRSGSRGVCAEVGGRGGGRGGRGAGPDTATAVDRAFPGLCRATFADGSTLAIMVADVGGGAARTVWRT